jgi:hypothetical protein
MILLLEEVKPFGSTVQCTQVTESNVTFGPYGRGRVQEDIQAYQGVHQTEDENLCVWDGVDVGAHHAHFVIFLVQIVQQNIA